MDDFGNGLLGPELCFRAGDEGVRVEVDGAVEERNVTDEVA